MNDIFYYLGVMYVIINIHRIFKNINKSKYPGAEELDSLSKSMPSDLTIMTRSELNKIKSSTQQVLHKAILPVVISIFFIIWIVVGYFYTSQGCLFLALFIISLAALLSPAIHFIVSIATSKEPIQKNAIKIAKGVEDSALIRKLSISEYTLKIIITTAILIQHFS